MSGEEKKNAGSVIQLVRICVESRADGGNGVNRLNSQYREVDQRSVGCAFVKNVFVDSARRSSDKRSKR